jgi:thiamine biosynthesis lipoprotein
LSSLEVLSADAIRADHVAVGHAMATRVTVRIPTDSCGDTRPSDASEKAMGVLHKVDAACTRFDTTSPLMRANRSPLLWHSVPEVLFRAVEEAKRAYDETHGLFDPRVLRDLVALGYVRTLPFGSEDLVLDAATSPAVGPLEPWRPRFRSGAHELVLGPQPIDLGGIGKGLAVRWAGEALSAATPDFLIDAGGDCYCAGRMADGTPWSIGVEDPFAPSQPVATLLLTDRAATTSSIRLRRWIANGRRVHHLIDPRTGQPGGRGLMSVTVVGKDPARAEVWSKALFIAGRARIAELARRRAIAALWVDEGGTCSISAAMERYVQWRRQ